MSEIKLLPCPFCNGEGHLYMDSFGKYFAGCEDCGFYYGIEIEHGCELEHGWKAKHSTKEEAIKQWNTRKPMERIIERLKEKRDESMYQHKFDDYFDGIIDSITIVREEGGIE